MRVQDPHRQDIDRGIPHAVNDGASYMRPMSIVVLRIVIRIHNIIPPKYAAFQEIVIFVYSGVLQG